MRGSPVGGSSMPGWALRPLSLPILSLAGLELLRAPVGAAMTRWTSLKASGPHKPALCGPVASRRHLSTRVLATSAWRVQESGAEPSSWRSTRGPHNGRLPASWPGRKQRPPLQPQASAPQTHGEVVSWSSGGGRMAVRKEAPAEPEVPKAGDLASDKLVRISALLLTGYVALGKSLNLSGSPFRVEVMTVATFLGF